MSFAEISNLHLFNLSKALLVEPVLLFLKTKNNQDKNGLFKNIIIYSYFFNYYTCTQTKPRKTITNFGEELCIQSIDFYRIFLRQSFAKIESNDVL